MAKYSDVIRGLQLLMEAEGDVHSICAEHDIIYAGPDEPSLADGYEKQREQMEKHGWHIDSESGRWALFV